MPIDLVWFDEPPPGPWQPGWAFPTPYEGWVSHHFLEHVSGTRPAIEVVLPTRGGGVTHFCIDSHPSDDENGNWNVVVEGELVAGEKPKITVTPSINCVGLYHGHITAGVITDDLGN